MGDFENLFDSVEGGGEYKTNESASAWQGAALTACQAILLSHSLIFLTGPRHINL
jgi:hypothetical protein